MAGTTSSRSESSWWPSPVWLTAAAVFGLAFFVVNLLFARSTQPPVIPEVDDPGKAVVYVSPIGMVPSEDRIKAKVFVQPPDTLLDPRGLTQDLTVHISGVEPLKFEAGLKSLAKDVDLLANESTYERYPFDRFTSLLLVNATTADPAGSEVDVPVQLVVFGKFPGWRVLPATGVSLPPEFAAEVVGTDVNPSGYALGTLTVARNGSTMSIVVILLVAMVVVTALAMRVARAVAMRRRKIEATMASWFAALLFAMVPLRTNMPGAPPIGVWIDFLVFLWVLIGLMIALSLFIGSWLRYTSPPPDFEPTRKD